MTSAELKILQDAADSKTYKETASTLNTSEARVKNLACSVFKELDVCTKSGAVAVALRRGLIE
jgi:DNA-binding CsgD family transcriptional regulator